MGPAASPHLASTSGPPEVSVCVFVCVGVCVCVVVGVCVCGGEGVCCCSEDSKTGGPSDPILTRPFWVSGVQREENDCERVVVGVSLKVRIFRKPAAKLSKETAFQL